MASNEPASATPSPARLKVGDKEYSEDELREAIRGGLRQDDYTRKTQELAERQRRLDEIEEELLERQQQYGRPQEASHVAEEDPWAQRFSRLESKFDQVTERLTKREQEEADERRIQEQVAGVEASLAAFSMKPGFDRQEVLQTMKAYGMDRPDQVEAAYRIVAGPKIGQSLGESLAISRGATAPTVMGGNGYAMTTPFANPAEAAPNVDYSQKSWEEVKAMALADPDRPR